MAIIISKNKKNAVKIDQSEIALEDNIQEYIVAPKPDLPFFRQAYKVVRRRQPTTANNSVC